MYLKSSEAKGRELLQTALLSEPLLSQRGELKEPKEMNWTY